MPRRTKEEAQETRARILEAAECVFSERGVSNTTMEHVACAAGVTRGAIYWHFKNKVDLFSAMHEAVRMPMKDVLYGIIESEPLDADSLKRLEDFCVASLTNLHQCERLQRVYGVILLKCEFSDGMESFVEQEKEAKLEVVDALAGFFDRAMAAGFAQAPHLPRAQAPRLLAHGLYAVMCGLYTEYLRTPENYDLPTDAPLLLRHFFAPLSPDQNH